MKHKTAILYDPVFLAHDTGNHPENYRRLEVIVEALNTAPFRDKLAWVKPVPATPTQVEMVHATSYVRQLEEAILSGKHYLDADTLVCHDSWEAALTAAGAVMTAVKGVSEGLYKNAFCAVRPPGHHAEISRAMGFCLLNNVAIGAKYARSALHMKKVAIIDFDVHHGNGTQNIFYADPTVFYVSLHLWPHYPGTGAANETGSGSATGFNLNIPMSEGMGDVEYLERMDNAVIPAMREFAPEMILVSSGFDAHGDDPLGGAALTETGFGEITRRIVGLAHELGHDRVVSVLEGGYNLHALALSVTAHVAELARD
ncbi:MAG: histone deacetylase [Nitrospinae bacterium]|nr:histone deacetylase [Nitrospinota bacterium]MBF0634075.1 histone deacetylase [Nitrospinota bacterium]